MSEKPAFSQREKKNPTRFHLVFGLEVARTQSLVLLCLFSRCCTVEGGGRVGVAAEKPHAEQVRLRNSPRENVKLPAGG